MMEFNEVPYTGDKRPFDFILKEPAAPEQVKGFLISEEKGEQYADLVLCMLLYQMNRKAMYINYMTGAKYLFTIFFGSTHQLDTPCAWSGPKTTEWVSGYRDLPTEDWNPAYEIQRLWLYTKIHWSWLERAWLHAETILWKHGQPWQIERLERVRPKCLNHSA
jgi:hypothetical protein